MAAVVLGVLSGDSWSRSYDQSRHQWWLELMICIYSSVEASYNCLCSVQGQMQTHI